MTTWTVPGTVTSIHDGDTLTAELDLGWHISLTSSIRLLGINAPELNTPAGKDALAYLRTLLAPGDPVTVVSARLLGATEKYGRVLAAVQTPSGQDVSTALLAAGHAQPYLVR
jgi:endonuclease YncB( thermonuclease family)